MRNFVLTIAAFLQSLVVGSVFPVAVLTDVTVVTAAVDQSWGGNGGGWFDFAAFASLNNALVRIGAFGVRRTAREHHRGRQFRHRQGAQLRSGADPDAFLLRPADAILL